MSGVIINIRSHSKNEESRDGPEPGVTISAEDVYDLIGFKIRIYFVEEGDIGQEQIRKGYTFGVLISLARDADRKKYILEMAVGPAYDQTHILCLANDIDLAKALEDLANSRREKERLAISEKKSS